MFINTRGKNREGFTQEFLDFMEYITASRDETADRAERGRIKLIHERVKKIRRSEKMGVKYMQFWEEKAYAREEGRAEGHTQKLIQLVCRMLQRGNTLEEIADDFGESIDYIEVIYQLAEKCGYDYEKIFVQMADR
ncbi:MAG: hypothetical protein HFI43_04685 [Lachnospiraceae bacterium]|nr:hypothetical protein [Lachnospiraceae bacterium]